VSELAPTGRRCYRNILPFVLVADIYTPPLADTS